MEKRRRPTIYKFDPPSPLRYPGGKYLLATYVSCVLEENFLTGCTFYEPYAGGASVSIELLKRGFISEAVLVERDPLIYSFWHSVFHDTDALCEALQRIRVTIQTWKRFQPLRDVTRPFGSQYTRLQLGIAGLFFNRTNFSGIVGAGPIGGLTQTSEYGIGCRFNADKIIRQIQAVAQHRKKVRVQFGDALGYLRRNAEALSTRFNFVYVDPPYYAQGKKLYRYYYEDSDHVALATYMREQGYPWLMSYDDHPRIRALYDTVGIQPIYLDYKAKSSRNARELLISNLVIPPPIYDVPVPAKHATGVTLHPAG